MFILTLKMPIRLQQTTFINTFALFSRENKTFDISCESSARQRIQMKHQALFSTKDKSTKKVSSAAIFICILRVKTTL